MTTQRGTHRLLPTDPVARVMVWPVATVYTDAALTAVAEELAADNVGAVGVLDRGSLVGVVSERDIVAHVATGADPSHLTAGEVMATDLVTASPADTVLDVARLMSETEVRHIPILEEGLIAGFVSMRDLFDVLLANASDGDVVVVPSGTRVVVAPE